MSTRNDRQRAPQGRRDAHLLELSQEMKRPPAVKRAAYKLIGRCRISGRRRLLVSSNKILLRPLPPPKLSSPQNRSLPSPHPPFFSTISRIGDHGLIGCVRAHEAKGRHDL